MIKLPKNYSGYVIVVIVLFFFLTACLGKQDPISNSATDQVAQPTSPPSITPVPSLTSTPAPTFTPTVTPVVVLDPGPIEVSFVTEDGAELDGLYYPARENPAPVLVLVHWAQGDLTEWGQIAPWLQNRGLFERSPDYNHSWKSSDWYPENPVDEPLGVFIFTLRNCRGGCQAYLPEEWLIDVEAAMLKVSGLQGVDKDRILTAGASIGADGALYGCAWLNQSELGHCKGSFSLSPASLLTVPYEELASQLIDSEPPLPLYCLYGLRDDASVETCSELPGLHSVDYGYIENHGMELFQPGQDPDPLVLLGEFINISLAGAGGVMHMKRIINVLLIAGLLLSFFGIDTVNAMGQGDGICNGPEGVIYILVIGTDTRSPGYLFGLADTTMVFRVDFQNQEVSVVGFPRDLWVEIPDVTEDDGRTHGKLNQAYFFGTAGMGYYSGEGYGAGLMAETMKHNWGLEIDHYIVLNMRAFRDVVDAIGGIEVYNPAPVYSFQQPNQPKVLVGGYFFSGQDALMYARYRDPKNSVDRVDRHAIIMKGLFKQIFDLSTIPKIPQLIGLYKGNVLTDMHLAELSQFLCLAARMDFEEVRFGRIPKETLYIPDWEGFVWLEKEPGSIEVMLQEFQNGNWPE